MLRPTTKRPLPSARGLRFGIVAARYNGELADALVEHCVAGLCDAGASPKHIRVVRVPGSFEVTAAAYRLAQTRRYGCVIGLGVLLEGETRHADLIGQAVAHGLTQVSIATGVPTVFGIVTANNPRQARVRCLSANYNRGREAAQTAIEMAQLCRTL
jgi:6,7-dimethyl-8-ribityllumazine synthase